MFLKTTSSCVYKPFLFLKMVEMQKASARFLFLYVYFIFYTIIRTKFDIFLIIYYFILIMFHFPADGSDLRSACRRSVSSVCAAVRHCVITRSVFLLRLFQTAERLFLFYAQFFLSVWTPALRRMLVCLPLCLWSEGRGARREPRVFGGVLLRMFTNRPNERGSIKH